MNKTVTINSNERFSIEDMHDSSRADGPLMSRCKQMESKSPYWFASISHTLVYKATKQSTKNTLHPQYDNIDGIVDCTTICEREI